MNALVLLSAAPVPLTTYAIDAGAPGVGSRAMCSSTRSHSVWCPFACALLIVVVRVLFLLYCRLFLLPPVGLGDDVIDTHIYKDLIN